MAKSKNLITVHSPVFRSTWQQCIPPSILPLGRRMAEAGKVKSITVLKEDRALKGVVQATRPYPVTVQIRPGPLGFCRLTTSCNCSQKKACAHVAALLFHFCSNGADPAPQTEENRSPALPASLASWIKELKQSEPQSIKPAPAASFAPMLLQLDFKASRQNPSRRFLTVIVGSYQWWTDSAHGPFKPLKLSSQLADSAPPEQKRLLRLLQVLGSKSEGGALLLDRDEAAEFLQAAIPQQVCYWRNVENPPLRLCPERSASLSWQIDELGNQTPTFTVEPAATVLPLNPPWYIDETSASAGLLTLPCSEEVLRGWMAAPVVRPEHSAQLEQALSQSNLSLPSPQSMEIKPLQAPLLPTLTLYSKPRCSMPFDIPSEPGEEDHERFLDGLRLQFSYHSHSFPWKDSATVKTVLEGSVLFRIERDVPEELKVLKKLRSCGFAPLHEVHFWNYSQQENQQDFIIEAYTNQSLQEKWLHFVLEEVPKLRAKGWKIEVEDSFRFRLAEPQDWYGTVEESSNIDWFDVELGVLVGQEKINLLPILMRLLQNPAHDMEQLLKDNRPMLLRLEDGRLMRLPTERVRQLLMHLLELYDPNLWQADGKLVVPRLRAAQLMGSGELAKVSWTGHEPLRELGRRLTQFDGIQSVPPPPRLQASLRPYQLQGLAWLQFLRHYSLAGILADDMGLGKTVQTLAHLLMEKESGRMDCPSLVVAPTSLMTNWYQEAGRFVPDLKVLVLHGLHRSEHYQSLKDYDLVLTTYPLLARDQEILSAQSWHLVILDEAQFIKNPKTQAAQVVGQLKARHRLCLTGTPMENHLGELWSLFHFLLPGFLGSERQFRSLFRTPIEKRQDSDRQKILAQRVAPFILRRHKETVALELPPKVEIIQKAELDGAQRDLYESIRLAMHARVQEEIAKKGLSRSHIIILDALLKLRQVCCDPRLLKLSSAKNVKESAKLELLMDLVPELVAENRKILLFSQFTSMLALIEVALTKAGIPFVTLTGDTKDRQTPITRFQNGEVPVFLISLRAGGTGLNLTAADTVIHYDPWWNPAVETQATDRAHRLGQVKKVFVYKLITSGTVEEKILALQDHKRELVRGLLDQNRKEPLALTQSDLQSLFAPL